MEKIQAGIGDKASLFLNGTSSFAIGYIVAFTISWKLALVVTIMLPVITSISAIVSKVSAYYFEIILIIIVALSHL